MRPNEFERVTREVFFAWIGPRDVHPRPRGRYADDSYGSDWIDQRTHQIVGRTVMTGEHPSNKTISEYYLLQRR
jgi:hypothetical protein